VKRIAVLAVALLLFAGCGSGDNGGSNNGGGGGGTTTNSGYGY
jgi:hypothetical protein